MEGVSRALPSDDVMCVAAGPTVLFLQENAGSIAHRLPVRTTPLANSACMAFQRACRRS